MGRIPQSAGDVAVRVAVCLLAAVAGLGEVVERRPFAGVVHVERTDTEPRPVSIHVLQVDLREPGIRLVMTEGGGSRETVRETTLEFLEKVKAQAAVNLHFWVPFPSAELNADLVGLAVSGGKVISSFEAPAQSYALVAHAPAIHISRDNRASIVRHGDNLEGLWNAFAGSARIVMGGAKTVPLYRDAQNPLGLLTPGGAAGYSNEKSWYEIPNARTVIGLARGNRVLTIFTVDRSARSRGMTPGEIAAMLIGDYGVTEALNMDGGGSTTLALRDPASGEGRVVNSPAEGRPRAVASNLGIFAGVP